MKVENCVDCRHNFIFHKLLLHPSDDDKRIYCRICEKVCEDCWDDPIDTDIEPKLWRTLNKGLY